MLSTVVLKSRRYNHVIADWLCDAHGVTSYKRDYFQFTPHGSDVVTPGGIFGTYSKRSMAMVPRELL